MNVEVTITAARGQRQKMDELAAAIERTVDTFAEWLGRAEVRAEVDPAADGLKAAPGASQPDPNRPLKVAHVGAGRLVFNKGRLDGIRAGDQVVVYGEPLQVRDPSTGAHLGYIAQQRAQVELATVEDRFSYAVRGPSWWSPKTEVGDAAEIAPGPAT